MEQHMEVISKLCRLRKQRIKLDTKYRNPKPVVELKSKISSIFNYDISLDKENQHPKHICRVCMAKLGKFNPDIEKCEVTDTATFEAHSDISCFCYKFCGRGRIQSEFFHNYQIVKEKAINLDSIIFEAQKEGFVQLKHDNEMIVVAKIDDAYSAKITVKVVNDLKWTVFLSKMEIPKDCLLLKPFSETLSKENIDVFFKTLSNCIICCGNDDFDELIDYRLGSDLCFKNNKNEIVANIQTGFESIANSKKVIRTVGCQYLVPNTKPRCDSCTSYRSTLRTLQTRVDKIKGSSVKKKRPHCSLNKKQMRKRLFKLSKEKKTLQRKNRLLETKIKSLIDDEGVILDTETHDIVEEQISKSEEFKFKENSVMDLLWKQQKQAAKLTKKTSMRWHPMIIRWCLSIYLRSQGKIFLVYF